MNTGDTIAAISTAAGRAGIGIVRVSGASLASFARAITLRDLAPRKATRATFSASDGSAIDDGIALFFPAPHSYTGQDVLELQGHGGPVVLRLLLQRCIELGARLADAGEFTQRAFVNGRLDLAQAEGVIDLIDAATAEAARGAARALRGEFSGEIQRLSWKIVELRMLIEATLDFPDEALDFVKDAAAAEKLRAVQEDLERVLEMARQGSILRDGIHVALAGEPNVGKSSLLNRLAGEELAIVTDTPGTTRDPIRESIDVGGVPVHIIDTAGVRQTADAIELIGVERAWKAIRDADAIVLVTDATSPELNGTQILAGLPEGVPRIRVINKIDLTGVHPQTERRTEEIVVRLSAKTGAGVELLRQALLDLIGWRAEGGGVYLARERHLVALRDARGHLELASERAPQLELLAEELRLAHGALGRITGEFTSDDLLGEIFSRFCIGK